MTITTSHPAVSLLLSSLLFSSAVSASCYFPNGKDQNIGVQADQGITYRPCNPDAKHSMCCAPWDTCTPDGLCQSGYDGNTWRDSCTDPTWKSPSCVKLCVSGFGQLTPYSRLRLFQLTSQTYADQKVIEAQTDLNMANNDVTVTQCSDRSYCCGNGTIAAQCCDNHLGVWIDPLTGQGTTQNPGGALPSTSTISHITHASYVTPVGSANPTRTSSSSNAITSALPLPATGLSSYAFTTPLLNSSVLDSLTSSPMTTSSASAANISTPTGNSSTIASSTSIATFKANSSAPITRVSLGYVKPIIGSVLVASLFSLAT